MKLRLAAAHRNPRKAYVLILVMVFVATSLLVLSGGLNWRSTRT